MGIEFQFEENENIQEMDDADGCDNVNVLNSIEFYT